MLIRKIRPDETYPFNLLLLADPSIENVNEYIQRGESFVGELDGIVIACYVLLPTRPHTVELVNIAVNEDYQDRGFGRQMIEHAIAQSRIQGYRVMELGTGNSSVGQLALYQKCGFRIVGVDLDFFVHHYPDPIFENGIQCRDMVRLIIYLE